MHLPTTPCSVGYVNPSHPPSRRRGQHPGLNVTTHAGCRVQPLRGGWDCPAPPRRETGRHRCIPYLTYRIDTPHSATTSTACVSGFFYRPEGSKCSIKSRLTRFQKPIRLPLFSIEAPAWAEMTKGVFGFIAQALMTLRRVWNAAKPIGYELISRFGTRVYFVSKYFPP